MNYLKIYTNLITTRKERKDIIGYTEKHHIKPRCLGGDNSDENLVRLTPREHFIAHILLAKAYPENKALTNAIIIMKAGREDYGYINARLYNTMRTKYGEELKGRKLSDETKRKLSEANKGKQLGVPKPEGFGEKVSQASRGKPKEYMSKLNKETKVGNKNFEGFRAYTHKVTKEVKYSKEALCSDWELGNAEMLGKVGSTKGTKWYHNPKTGQTKMCKLNEVPNGWVLGRTSNLND